MKLAITLLTSASAAALLIFATPALASGRDTARGGAADLVKRPAVTTPGHVNLTSSQQVTTQPCPSCQTIKTVQVVSEGKRNLPKTVGMEKHLCPECKTSIQLSGHGKAKTEKVVHVCVAPTATAMACCAQ